ncbi:MAG: DNA repair protein RadA [Oscillospiraceae bacterium]|nr:DNA repair protein RadA [Oscillospiraceae bacterium]
MKAKSVYICSECGYEALKWLGKCPSCGRWNTIDEVTSYAKGAANIPKVRTEDIKSINQIKTEDEVRYKTGIGELDRVLGGGIVKGSLILVGGDPGIGKSTLLLQLCRSSGRKILYVSGEESEIQIKLRAERLGVNSENLYIVSETEVSKTEAYIAAAKPEIVIIDSIQTMHSDEVSSAAGSVSQVREATNIFMRIAKESSAAMFIVGHVTKEGAIAGPRILEHMVDCVLYFEGDRNMSFRILRAVKNRFGSTNEIGVFDMNTTGLTEVENPSAVLLEGRSTDISGNTVICAMEGSRGVLAEVQSLVTKTSFGNPRRMGSGVDPGRLILLIAVLEKRINLKLSYCDVYVNVAGGMKIDEPAADLGICMSIFGGMNDVCMPPDMIFIGEVGLGGEIRGVTRLEKRLSEAYKMGFSRAVVPAMSMKGINIPEGMKVKGIKNLKEAISCVV